MNFRFSSHALEEMQRRKIPIGFVDSVLENPQQTLQQNEEIKIYQSQLDFGIDRRYLLRVFVNTTINPAVVVTVYRTSQIKKYWRTP